MNVFHLFTGFHEKFSTNEICLNFLDQYKWQNGYQCLKCGSKEYRHSNSIHHRRCLQCGYEESVTAHTVFHNIKFPLTKAFYMVYRIRQSQGKITAVKLMLECLSSIHTASKFKMRVITQLLAAQKEIKPADLNYENFLDGLIYQQANN